MGERQAPEAHQVQWGDATGFAELRASWLCMLHYRRLVKDLPRTLAGELAYFSKLNAHEKEHAVKKPEGDEALAMDLRQITELLDGSPKLVLDVGCGSAWTTRRLGEIGHEVIGVDICRELVCAGVTERGRLLKNERHLICDYQKLPFSAGFDVLVSYDALHHAASLPQALRSFARALKPGGLIVICEPGLWHHRAATSQAAVSRFGVTERSVPPFLLGRLLPECGFTAIRFEQRWSRIHLGQRRYFKFFRQMIGEKWATQISVLRSVSAGGLICALRSNVPIDDLP